jgi:hypothetical protein
MSWGRELHGLGIHMNMYFAYNLVTLKRRDQGLSIKNELPLAQVAFV